MLAKVFSFGLFGIDAYPLEIEVDIARGLPAVTLVGLADTAIRESKERVKSAIKNSGFSWPSERIIVSLLPSGMKKEGACFDLAIALGVLAASQQLNSARLKDYYILGELSLDGSVRPTPGVLPISIAIAKSLPGQQRGLLGRQQPCAIKNLLVSSDNAKEAAVVADICIWPVKTLKEAVEFLNNPDTIQPFKLNLAELFKENANYQVDFSEVKGQYVAKRALEVAAAGGHNLVMIGPLPEVAKLCLPKESLPLCLI